MPVYVDPLFDTRGWSRAWPYPSACHLVADTLDELHAFAAALGLRRAWFQASPPASHNHYDLTATRRRRAVALGAIEVDSAFVVALARAARWTSLAGVDNPSRPCDDAPMPRKRTPKAVATAAAVLDEITQTPAEAMMATVAAALDGDAATSASVLHCLTTLAPLIASCRAAGVPVPDEIAGRMPSLAEIADEFQRQHEAAAEAEKAKKILREAILEQLDDPEENPDGEDIIQRDGFALERRAKPGRESLSEVKLVELGVDPALLRQATVQGDPYWELHVVWPRKGKGAA